LSGGLDSRHIVLELVRQGLRPDFVVTVGPPTGGIGREVAAAAAVADAFGLRHVVVRSRQRRLSDEEEKNVVTSFCTDSHTWILALRDVMLAEGVKSSYDGIGGDVLSNGVFLESERHELFMAGRHHELADLLLGSNEPWMVRLLSAASYAEMRRPRAIERLVRELKTHEGALSPVTSFHFWNRTRRTATMSPYGMLAHIPTVFSPYLDHELFDFLAGLPPDLLVTHTFHEEAIRRAYPESAGLAYAPKGSGGELLGALRTSTAELMLRLLWQPSELVDTGATLMRLAAGLVGLRSPRWWFFQAAYLRQIGLVRERRHAESRYSADDGRAVAP
jgi:asparagine synthetase B (glutamine-hydrolysing)